MRKKFLISIIFLFSLINLKPVYSASLYELFWQRSWAQMENNFNAQSKKSARDYALMANAYRFQEKWNEAVKILETQSKNLPENIKPYADMTLLLGYEKLKRTNDAINLAERFYRVAPADLKYYVAFAQYRLYDSIHDSNNLQNALNRMLELANTDDRKIFTLTKLITNNKNANNALQLLELQPTNKDAAQILSQIKTPSNSVKIALGVYYHQTGNNKQAEEILKNLSSRKAIYYRAWALSRLKNNTAALNLWSGLALNGNSYALASVTRISNLAKDKGMMDACLNTLVKISKNRKGDIKARALQSLANLYPQGNNKTNVEAQILKSFPNTRYSFNVLWARAWKNIEAGNYAEAAKLFKLADAPGVDTYTRARILHWLAYAQNHSGQKSEAEKTMNTLKNKYPLTIYALLANKNLKIINGTNPNLTLKPTELEQYGFINHAYLKLSRPKASTRELYRALILSKWLGSDEAYSEARRMENLLTTGKGTTFYRFDLEALYPRAYKSQVEAAAKKYGVEKNFIWAIMRQESAFKVNARSWVGAAGLMQLMPATAKEEAKRAGLAKYNLYNANDNIILGASHLGWLSKSFSKKEWVMAAYNAGSGNARKWLKDGGDSLNLPRWIETITLSETLGYVQRVYANLEVYRLLYGTEQD